MIFLPIVNRELRVRARQGTTYWGRCAAATVSVIAAMEAMTFYAKAVRPAALGGLTFATLSWVLMAIVSASVLITADTISIERREGTLGLLFLTKLSGADVVMGKLAAAGVATFYALVGFLPGLALALLSGGITGGRLASTMLSLLNAIFVALAAGLWVSIRAPNRLHAMRRAVGISALLFGFPFLLTLLSSRTWLTVPVLFSPYGAFHLASAGSGAATAQFWFSLIVAHCGGWLFLWGSVVAICRAWCESDVAEIPAPKPIKTEARASPEAKGLLNQNLPDAGPVPITFARQGLLEQDPVYWVASRVPGRKALIRVGTVLLLLGVLLGTLLLPIGLNLWGSVNLLLSLGSGCAFAWLAGRFFFEARRSGELELLLSTPLGARDIVSGYWWAVWRHLRSPLLLVGFATFLQFLFFFTSGPWSSRGLNVFHVVIGPFNRVLDVIALSWVGMWFGLRARKPSLVVVWTAGLVIGLPWLLASILSISSSVRGLSGRSGAMGSNFWFVVWPMIYLGKNLLAIRWAAAKLQEELRAKAPLAVSEWFSETGSEFDKGSLTVLEDRLPSSHPLNGA